MAQKRLTIVIPFYNEVELLPTALTSIALQEIDELEVLIVNDNPDAFSQDFFDGLALPQYCRVLHHDVNKGLPSSRNTGIDAATGRYIAFLDADDYFVPGGLKAILGEAEAANADITHALPFHTAPNTSTGRILQDILHENVGDELIEDPERIFEVGFWIQASWSNIYSAEFLEREKLRFDPTQVKFEDRLFVVGALLKTKRFLLSTQKFIVYSRRESSITTSYKSFSEAEMKAASWNKILMLISESDLSDRRHWLVKEYMRQFLEIVWMTNMVLWMDTFAKLGKPEAGAFEDILVGSAELVHPTSDEIVSIYNDQFARYTDGDTGNGRLNATDLYTLSEALRKRDFSAYYALIESIGILADRVVSLPLPTVREGGKEIILHFGLHKTGTTHIQKQLFHNRSTLLKAGILFPETGFGYDRGQVPVRGEGLSGHMNLMFGILREEPDTINELEREISESECEKVIISVENLLPTTASNLNKAEPSNTSRCKNLVRMVSRLSEYGHVSPVAMYRRPDAWFESLYREILMHGQGSGYQKPGEFLVNNVGLLDFGGLISTAEDLLSRSVTIQSFDEAVKGDGDLVTSFLKECGCDIDDSALSIIPNSRYEALCNAQVEVLRMVVPLMPSVMRRKAVMTTFLQLVEPTGQKGSIFTRSERQRMIEIFCDSTDALFRERGLPDSRTEWLADVAEAPEPVPPEVPGSYLEALRLAGQLNAGNDLELSDAEIAKTRRRLVRAEKRAEQVTELRSELAEARGRLSYMNNSVSWRVTEPMRKALGAYKSVTGRD